MVAYWSEGQEPQLAAEHSLELYFTEHPIIGWINWAAACLVEPLGFMFWAAWAVLIIGYFWAGTSSG